MGYSSVEAHKRIERLVARTVGGVPERKYYRFRVDRWYGGIVTGDCVGCGLSCKFCWVSDKVRYRPRFVGKFYKPAEVADRLTTLAGRRGLRQLRLSGGEPTIGKHHLLNLLDELKGCGYTFILETNGILLGYDEDYAKQLGRYDFIHVRVSLKGCCEEEFARLTNANPEDFKLQLKALENLVKHGVECHPAVMISFSTKESLNSLLRRLSEIDQSLVEEFEIEELILYPHVVERLKKYRLEYLTGYTPDRVPPEQI